jgi:putative flippase GtrA
VRSGLITEFWRLVRFLLIGGIATAVYVSAALMAVEWAGRSPMVSSTVGFCASFAVSYLGHFHFTFAVPGRYRDYVVRFAVSSLASFLISTLAMWLSTKLLELDYRIALIAVAIIIPVCSYLINRFWVFLDQLDVASSDQTFKTI